MIRALYEMQKLRRKSQSMKKRRQKAKIKSQGKRRRGSIARDHYLDHNRAQDHEQEIELQGHHGKVQKEEKSQRPKKISKQSKNCKKILLVKDKIKVMTTKETR